MHFVTLSKGLGTSALTDHYKKHSLKESRRYYGVIINSKLGKYQKLSYLEKKNSVHKKAPHSWIYNILPCYRIYNSKLISKKFPKKLKALLVDIQLRTGNFSRF